MVDMDVVKQRLLRGAYVAAGVVAGDNVQDFVADEVDNRFAPAAAGIALGLGTAVGVDEVFTNTRGIPNDVFEYGGYGLQGAGWNNLFETVVVETNNQTGADVIRVDAQTSTTPRQSQASNASSAGAQPVSVDV